MTVPATSPEPARATRCATSTVAFHQPARWLVDGTPRCDMCKDVIQKRDGVVTVQLIPEPAPARVADTGEARCDCGGTGVCSFCRGGSRNEPGLDCPACNNTHVCGIRGCPAAASPGTPEAWPQNADDVPDAVFAAVAAEVDPEPDPRDYPLVENASFRSAVIGAYRHGLAARDGEVRQLRDQLAARDAQLTSALNEIADRP